MVVNFEIETEIELMYNDRIIDLHNNFDFTSVEYIKDTNKLFIRFHKSNGDWIKENEFNKLLFIHNDVSYMYIKDRDEAVYESLGEITFYPSEDRETNDAIMLQKRPNTGDDIIYSFISDFFIRVGCQSIELICD